MSSIYTLYKDILPPSAINACAEARFVSPRAVNLVVARAGLLQVYNIVEEDAPSADSSASVDDPEEKDLEKTQSRPINASASPDRTPKIARLELFAQFKLYGNITSIGVVRTTTSVGVLGMDSLLLSFKDAKLSLIEYSEATRNIVTVSIHYYEREEFKTITSCLSTQYRMCQIQKEALTDKWIPEIRVDPQNRCAVLNFYNDRLAILPFKQDGGVVDVDEATRFVAAKMTASRLRTFPPSKYPFSPSFVIPVSSIDPKIRNVVDMTFLYDYFEPTLAILFETVQTWTGRLVARKDTKSLIVVSLNISQKSYPVLFQVDGLAYNCHKLVPVPSPVGGILIFSPNAIIHMDQTSVPGVVCAVNAYYGIESSIPSSAPESSSSAPPSSSLNPLYNRAIISDFTLCGLSLEGCVAYFINPDTVMLVLRSGELIVVQLEGQDAGGSGWKRRKSGVRKFSLRRLGLRAVLPSCGVRIEGLGIGRASRGLGGIGGLADAAERTTHYGYAFVASRVADSLLIQFTESGDFAVGGGVAAVDPLMEGSVASAASTPGPSSSAALELDDDMDEDIYGASTFETPAQAQPSGINGTTLAPAQIATVSATSEPPLRFRVTDSLICTGPIRDAAVGEPTTYSTSPFTPPSHRLDLEVVTCVGEGVHGALGILHRSVRPQIVSSFELPDVSDMWTVRCRRRRGPAGGTGPADETESSIVGFGSAEGTALGSSVGSAVGSTVSSPGRGALADAGPEAGSVDADIGAARRTDPMDFELEGSGGGDTANGIQGNGIQGAPDGDVEMGSDANNAPSMKDGENEEFTRFLVLSRESGTSILETGAANSSRD
ncbi:hypothetical protein BDK51DRAFT_51243 [Blyttiomyces helicus]|uniref:RSE1/DDB1/CPSF1 first beta-propeller domain-containing protein n=1 Tax=Blyttiomyces helicus TaxID=388810 RepID=A0A4P9WIS9_9FUNG|nr:hypothetical protein BDK51DRAFT_51243 [Blyttiomyces helicus]|eukprot:RKO91040.1 hypothetical protein BDK51DRAFT_51243 [Blyttiomyces helicus]